MLTAWPSNSRPTGHRESSARTDGGRGSGGVPQRPHRGHHGAVTMGARRRRQTGADFGGGGGSDVGIMADFFMQFTTPTNVVQSNSARNQLTVDHTKIVKHALFTRKQRRCCGEHISKLE